MFDFLCAKKVDNEKIIKIIEENIEKYHTNIEIDGNGKVNVFFGSKRENKECE